MLKWAITHVPMPKTPEKDPRGPALSSTKTSFVPHISAAQTTKHTPPESYDLPNVFEFSQKDGILPGPNPSTGAKNSSGNTLTSSMGSVSASPENLIHITFKPDRILLT